MIKGGLTTQPVPCKGTTSTSDDVSTLDPLEDTDYTTCILPLGQGSKMARVTLEMFNPTQTLLQVVTAISKDASCNPLGVALAAETVDNNFVECTLVDEDNTDVAVRIYIAAENETENCIQ